MPLEPDVDPWEGTHGERGPERDNPMDGAGSGVFGASPETVGVPDVTGRTPAPGRRATGWSPGVLLAVIALLLVVAGSSAYLWLF